MEIIASLLSEPSADQAACSSTSMSAVTGSACAHLLQSTCCSRVGIPTPPQAHRNPSMGLVGLVQREQVQVKKYFSNSSSWRRSRGAVLSIYDIKISAFAGMSSSARTWRVRPSKSMTALGVQSWFMLAASGSKAIPMGSKVSVTRVTEFTSTCIIILQPPLSNTITRRKKENGKDPTNSTI